MKKFYFILVLLVNICIAEAQPSAVKLLAQVPCTSVKDQYMSSTCWSFASNSFIESELMKKGIVAVDLSEMFIARYSYINKIKQHLATNGKSYFTPGGQFHDVLKVIREYGMVPEFAYTGRARNEINHDHNELDTLMKDMMARMLKAKKRMPSSADLDSINNLLDYYLGKVPKTFSFRGKMYTPKTFASDFLKFNPEDYVEITSYTHHPFYKPFILEDKYNWSNDLYYNVPLNDFTTITDGALKEGYSICWDGDVSEVGFKYQENIATIPLPIKNFTTERQRTYEDHTSELDHMMHIVGMGKDAKGEEWYYVKNSWGINNTAGGFMYMQKAYFKIKTMAIIVNKNAIPVEIRKKIGI